MNLELQGDRTLMEWWRDGGMEEWIVGLLDCWIVGLESEGLLVLARPTFPGGTLWCDLAGITWNYLELARLSG